VKELVTNAVKYGPQNVPIFTGVYLTLDNKVFACNDGGSYFKDSRVKSDWENKIKFSREERGGKGSGLGQSMLYTNYNEIFIDTTQGTIYI
jgi:two-component sensor histidine kinase